MVKGVDLRQCSLVLAEQAEVDQRSRSLMHQLLSCQQVAHRRGVASAALVAMGARPLAMDLSYDMLAYGAATPPPGVVANICTLPLTDDAVDDCVAAFVLNHLVHPEDRLAELIRVTRRKSALLACVYSNASRSEVRDLVDDARATSARRARRVPSQGCLAADDGRACPRPAARLRQCACSYLFANDRVPAPEGGRLREVSAACPTRVRLAPAPPFS
jgi:hypothetical protein